MAFVYTFWLMPAEPLKIRLRAIVRNLAREFDAPEFDPHVTFYVGAANADEARSAAQKIAREFAPVELNVQGSDQSPQFTKTFFVQFHELGPAKRMCEMLRGSVASPSDYVLDPHLSLLYKHLNEEQRQELCRRKLIPEGAYVFDAVQAVEFEPPWSGTYRALGEYLLNPPA